MNQTSLKQNEHIQRALEDDLFQNQDEFYHKLEQFYRTHTSHFYFPEDICLFYPKITEHRSKIDRICDISKAKIKKATFYCYYQFLLINLSAGKKYVLKKEICAETAYYDFFPRNLWELEQLASYLENPDYLENKYGDYRDLSINLGETLELKEVRQKRKLKS